MSERWQYQIKTGLFYGILASILLTLFELVEKSFSDAFLTYTFMLRVVVLILAGIFLVGYSNWKSKEKLKK